MTYSLGQLREQCLIFLEFIHSYNKSSIQNKKHIINIIPVIIKGFSMINGLFIQNERLIITYFIFGLHYSFWMIGLKLH